MKSVQFRQNPPFLVRLARGIARCVSGRSRRFTADAADATAPAYAIFESLERIGPDRRGKYRWVLTVNGRLVDLTTSELWAGPASARFRAKVALLAGRLSPPLRGDAWLDVLARLPRLDLLSAELAEKMENRIATGGDGVSRDADRSR